MDALISPRREELLEACEAHLAHAGSNYLPFVWRAYKSHRATLFGLLDALPLRSTSQDATVEEALRFLQTHAGRTGEWLRMTHTERDESGQPVQVPLLDFSWVPDRWWPLLTDQSRRDRFPDRKSAPVEEESRSACRPATYLRSTPVVSQTSRLNQRAWPQRDTLADPSRTGRTTASTMVTTSRSSVVTRDPATQPCSHGPRPSAVGMFFG